MPPKKKTTAALVSIEQIEARIHIIRGQRVMLDFDAAVLYGVTTSAVNEAVTRNANRFPDDFAFRLTDHEVADRGCDRENTTRPTPMAFTEYGIVMLSSVLRSRTAATASVMILRTQFAAAPVV